MTESAAPILMSMVEPCDVPLYHTVYHSKQANPELSSGI
jgi:hypothetical protein